jgi:D-alanyl-D-alanine dipeptidase
MESQKEILPTFLAPSRYLPEGLDGLRKTCLQLGFRSIDELLPTCRKKIAYSGTSNFMETDLYGDFTECFLAPIVAEMLVFAHRNLIETHPHLTFLLYDAARPVRVQKAMWEYVKNTEMQDFVADPLEGSMHNYGSAIDLSLCTTEGLELDMGTIFDHFGELAEPQKEKELLSSGKLKEEQVKNRILLRDPMEKAGFRVRPNEWWHFDAFDLETAKRKFQLFL